jgi:predicted acyltransferase
MVMLFVTALYMGLMLNFTDSQSKPVCTKLNNLTASCNFGRWFDFIILGPKHSYFEPTDPEGIFTTLSAVLTAYGGYYFSLIMQKHK